MGALWLVFSGHVHFQRNGKPKISGLVEKSGVFRVNLPDIQQCPGNLASIMQVPIAIAWLIALHRPYLNPHGQEQAALRGCLEL